MCLNNSRKCKNPQVKGEDNKPHPEKQKITSYLVEMKSGSEGRKNTITW